MATSAFGIPIEIFPRIDPAVREILEFCSEFFVRKQHPPAAKDPDWWQTPQTNQKASQICVLPPASKNRYHDPAASSIDLATLLDACAGVQNHPLATARYWPS